MITLTVYIFALISENQIKRSKILVNGWNETKNNFNDLIKSSYGTYNTFLFQQKEKQLEDIVMKKVTAGYR